MPYYLFISLDLVTGQSRLIDRRLCNFPEEILPELAKQECLVRYRTDALAVNTIKGSHPTKFVVTLDNYTLWEITETKTVGWLSSSTEKVPIALIRFLFVEDKPIVPTTTILPFTPPVVRRPSEKVFKSIHNKEIESFDKMKLRSVSQSADNQLSAAANE